VKTLIKSQGDELHFVVSELVKALFERFRQFQVIFGVEVREGF